MSQEPKYSTEIQNFIIEALKASKDGFGVFDQTDTLVFCNQTLAQNFGITVNEALGKSFEELLTISYHSPRGLKSDEGGFEGMLERAKISRLQKGFASFESDHANGEWTHVSRLRTDDDFIYIYTTDITQLKKTEATLRETLSYMKNLASTDSLTGISNRRHFLEAGHKEFDRAKRYGHPLSILALDIDHFKSINDTYGHQAGDKVLESITLDCANLLRSSDIFGRLGGEEFSILLPDTDASAAKETAQRVLNGVASIKVPHEGKVIQFTTSIGIAHVSDRCGSLEELMKLSDDALYQAKHNGRNRLEECA